MRCDAIRTTPCLSGSCSIVSMQAQLKVIGRVLETLDNPEDKYALRLQRRQKRQVPTAGPRGEWTSRRLSAPLPHSAPPFEADPQIPQLPLTHGLILIPIPVRVLVLGLSFNRRAVRKLKVYVNFDKSLHY
uniref:HDC07434 n=1 Tax=Drosophila melanogaster TaxID=7227 RepID=Q6IM64_DROME|nr:TPA_inf: HDC07434 [Drosophila melanogaster]